MARLANIKSWVTSHATKLVFFLLVTAEWTTENFALVP